MFLRARKQNTASLHCEDLFFQQLLSNTLILQESTDSRLAVCQSVTYWDGASNTCFLHSSFPTPACEIPQLQTSVCSLHSFTWPNFEERKDREKGQREQRQYPLEHCTGTWKTSSSKHSRNNSASKSAFSFKTLMAKPASEICKICTCLTGNVQMWKRRQQMCNDQRISHFSLGQFEGYCCRSTNPSL